MIFKFRLVSDEVDKFKREIQIDADATFMDLRNVILDSVGYDRQQMSSFFLCDDSWEKDREITQEDMGLDSSEDAYLMDECTLRDFIEDDGQKLIFVFDYMTERSFFMEMKESEPGKNLIEPLCTLSLGAAPQQYIDIDEFDAKTDARTAKAAAVTADDDDLGEEFYGSDQYSDDEFNPDAFDELDFK